VSVPAVPLAARLRHVSPGTPRGRRSVPLKNRCASVSPKGQQGVDRRTSYQPAPKKHRPRAWTGPPSQRSSWLATTWRRPAPRRRGCRPPERQLWAPVEGLRLAHRHTDD
jgi:hypothetical protein